MLRWPDAAVVTHALRRWACAISRQRQGVLRIGYFGSYARGDWGVGSDLDLVIVVESDEHPFRQRASQWDATVLPVPVDVLVYTKPEWDGLDPHRRLTQALREETVWVWEHRMGDKLGFR